MANLKYEFRVTNVALGAADTINVTLGENLENVNPAGYPNPTPSGVSNINLILSKEDAKNITPGDIFTVTLSPK